MTRCPLLLALAALALPARSPDTADSPLAPSAPSLAAGSSGAPSAARRATELPFGGTLEAEETAEFLPATNSLRVRLVGTGTAAHLGRYTVVADFTAALATTTAVGRITLTAANGDVLTAEFTGQDVIAGGINAIVETATITGGTGRFARATGGFMLQRLLTTATGVSSGSFEGTIDLHR